MQLVKTDIAHNERWPRKGVMYAPQFLLKSGDELLFNWTPVNQNQKLKIGIESELSTDEIILSTTNSYVVRNDNLTTILIENLPEYKLYGHLIITLNSNQNKNPFPETKYQYEYSSDKEIMIKKCINSYLDNSVGANIIIKSESPINERPFFNSAIDKFDEIFKSERYIYKQKLFRFDKDEIINISFIRPNNQNVFVGMSLEKANSKGTYGTFNENCYFICNSSDYYILEIFKHSTQVAIEEENFGIVKLHSNKEKQEHVNYEVVYNELFRKNELEPIKASM